MKKKQRILTVILILVLAAVLIAGIIGGTLMLFKRPSSSPGESGASSPDGMESPAGPVAAYPLTPLNAVGFGELSAAMQPSDGLFTGTETALVTSDALLETAEGEVASSSSFLRFNGFSQKMTDVSHLLLYVKLPAANVVSVTAHTYDSYTGSIHEMSLAPDMEYQVMALGADEWEDARTIAAGSAQNYGGGMVFDDAFEGYVKIEIAGMGDEDENFAILPEIDFLRGLSIRFEKIGGSYGSVEVLPYLVTDDGGGQPALAEGWTMPEGADGVLQVSPVTDVTLSQSAYAAISAQLVSPLDSVSGVQGIQMTPGDLTQSGATGGYIRDSANTQWKFYAALQLNELSLGNTEGIVFYVKTDSANRIVFTMDLTIPEDAARWRSNFAPIMQMKVGAEYQYMPEGEETWRESTAVVGMDGNQTWFAAIQFESAFEGYVKIPYSSLAHDSGTFTMDPNIDCATQITFHVDSIGGEYGSLTVGPVFTVKKDGFRELSITSPDEEPAAQGTPTGVMPEDTKEKIAYILDQSRQGNVEGHYYMIGDSTRYLIGSPTFRLIRDVFTNEYNLTCVRQSMGGLKTEHWSGHTPNLQPEWCPTVDWLIDIIPGTGEYCIVDISLGINDTPDHTAQEIADLLLEGIRKLKEAKPDVAVVYTTPNRIQPVSSEDKLREAASLLAQAEPSVWIIDVLDGVMDQYYEDYFADEVHPNREGYRAIASYMLSCYLEDYTYEPITAADYSAVEAAIAKIPSDFSGYTSSSIRAVNSAKNAVVWGMDSRHQEEIDAWAAAIESAVAALEKETGSDS